MSPKAGGKRLKDFGLKRLECEIDDVLEQAKELRLFAGENSEGGRKKDF